MGTQEGERKVEGASNSGNPRGKGEAITLGHEGPLIRLLRALPSWPDPVEPPPRTSRDIAAIRRIKA